jgi:O-antigen ligase
VGYIERLKEMNETNSNKSKRRKKPCKNKTSYFLFFLIVISTVLFRTEEYIVIYAIISIIVSAFVLLKMISKPSIISRAIMNVFMVWLIVLFTMYFIYGIGLTRYDYFSIKYFLLMFIMLVNTLVIFASINSEELIEIFINTTSVASVGIAIFVIINEWDQLFLGGIRIGETGSGNVNTLAIYMGILSVVCLFKLMFEKEVKYLLPYFSSVLIILLSGSKKGLIYVLLGIIIFSVLKNRIKIYKYIPVVVFVFCIFTVVMNMEYFYNIIGFRIVDFISTLGFNVEGAHSSHSTMLRLLMNRLGYRAFLENPIFGGGWFYFSKFSGLGTYSHNNYLEILVTYGIVGFLLYYSMYIKVCINLYKSIRVDDHSKLLLTIIILNLITDVASVSFSYNLLNYIVLLIAFLYVKKRSRENFERKTLNERNIITH